MITQKNNISLQQQKWEGTNLLKLFSWNAITTILANTSIIKALTRFYSALLDHKFKAKQIVFLCYGQAASVIAFLPYHINLGWRILFLYIFWQAIKRSGIMKQL